MRLRCVAPASPASPVNLFSAHRSPCHRPASRPPPGPGFHRHPNRHSHGRRGSDWLLVRSRTFRQIAKERVSCPRALRSSRPCLNTKHPTERRGSNFLARHRLCPSKYKHHTFRLFSNSERGTCGHGVDDVPETFDEKSMRALRTQVSSGQKQIAKRSSMNLLEYSGSLNSSLVRRHACVAC